ncbi:hypothetical protein D9M71_794280 [compost metagenome]
MVSIVLVPMANWEKGWCEGALPAFRNYDRWRVNQIGCHCRYNGKFESSASSTTFRISTSLKLYVVWECRKRNL